uniref:Uncharacterized protein n=1 Tax=Schistocephalus solidus TaxID=70667 RepID=A0A0X3P077_SCHSO
MASTPVTTQKPHTTCATGVVNPLRDRQNAIADGGGKLREKVDQNTWFPDKKNKLSEDPPRPPVRVAKAAPERLVAPSSTTDLDDPPPSYDEAWDIRPSRLGLASIAGPPGFSGLSNSSGLKSVPSQPQSPVANLPLKLSSDSLAHRCPPDGAATFETCSSQVVSSTCSLDSAAAEMQEKNSDGSFIKVENPSNVKETNKEKTPDTPVPASVMDESTGGGLFTPTTSSSWFPPPPPTPLHLSLLPEPEGSAPGRYHEHRRAFELDEDGSDENNVAVGAPSDPSDSISLPPLSPLPPPPPLPAEYAYSNAANQPGRTSAASSLNLPPPPPLQDAAVPPPAVPPRDPSTALQTPVTISNHVETQTSNPRPLAIPNEANSLPSADIKDSVTEDGVTIEASGTSTRVKQNGSLTVNQPTPRSKSSRDLIDGRSVVPWEVNSQDLVPERAAANIGFPESLPQWVPPQHSEVPLKQRLIAHPTDCAPLAPAAVTRHRSTKSQGCDGDFLADACFEDEARSRPVSLAARSSANHHHHHRRRHTTSNFGGLSADAVPGDVMHAGVVTAEGIRQRTTLRMNSDSAAVATTSASQSRAPIAGDVWGSPIPPPKDGFDGDSMSQFVRVAYDVRPTGRPSQKQQQQPQLAHLSKSSHPRSVATHRQVPEPTGPDAIDMPESMTRSLIMLPDQPDGNPSGSGFPWPVVTEQAAVQFAPPSASQKAAQQTRICRRMRALHLTGGNSGGVLSPQDAAAIQYSGLEYAGQRHSLGSSRLHRVPQAVIVPKISPESSFRDMTQSAWLPHEAEWVPHAQSLSSELCSPQEGYILQTQISCPSQVGGYRNSHAADEMMAWADVEGQFGPRSSEVLLHCRGSYTAPTQFAATAAAYPGQSYMLWPRVVGSRRRRHGSHTTQPIIVSAAAHDRADLAYPADPPQARTAGACSTKSGTPQHQQQHERPRVLVANRRQRPNGVDMATVASLPIEEQPKDENRKTSVILVSPPPISLSALRSLRLGSLLEVSCLPFETHLVSVSLILIQ